MKSKSSPPRLFHRFFRWYCKPRLRDHIEGDLFELYNERVTKKGKQKADILFIVDVIRLFRPGIVRSQGKPGYNISSSYNIFKNHFMRFKNFIIAFRSLRKDVAYTVINAVGLIIGITCCLLIFSFVKYELSFDDFNTKKDQLYRLNYDVTMGGNETVSPSVPVFVGPALKNKFPEIEDVTRFSPEWVPRTIRRGDVFFDESGFMYADPNFFKVFDFKPVNGNLQTALTKPNTLVITQRMADKYFGKTNPIGQVLTFNNKKQFEVVAVMEDVPSNSHFTFDFLTSFYSIHGFDSLETQEVWNNPNYSTFLLLKPGANKESLTKKIENWVNPPAEGGKTSSNSIHLNLQPLKEAHFDTKAYNYKNMIATTDFKYVSVFIIVALMILSIACANYINLSTAKASVRAKEVGIRKAIGANFSQLFVQFLAESFFLTSLAVIASIMTVYLLLPYLNNLLGKQIPFSLFDGSVFFSIVVGTILISLLAGFYPALVLSRFKPVETLKGDLTKIGRSGVSARKVLVVFQFSISIALILGTIIVRSQLNYMQSTKLGLDKEHVLIIQGNADLGNNLSVFANDVKKISGVQNVSLTWRSPFQTVVGNGFSIKANPATDDDWNVVGAMAGDQHYLATLGISLLAGRNFDPAKIKGDSTINEFMVNEAF
ncbi:MAG: ABC transporter permease, partial [Bacteroidota bacterium]